jgi:hypothetical protein
MVTAISEKISQPLCGPRSWVHGLQRQPLTLCPYRLTGQGLWNLLRWLRKSEKIFGPAVGFLEGTVVGSLQHQVRQIKLLMSRANVRDGPYRLEE